MKVESPVLLPALRDSIGFEIGSISNVLAVFASIHENACYVWTVVDKSETEIRRQVYQKEKILINRFGRVDFEFNVVAAGGYDPKQLAKDSATTAAFLRG